MIIMNFEKSNSIFNDSNQTISFLKKEVEKFVKDRKWNKYHTPKELAQAISIESAELLELFLFKSPSLEEILNNPNIFSKISEEFADIFIYLLSFANAINLDLSYAFQKKMEKNRKKYPLTEVSNGTYKKK